MVLEKGVLKEFITWSNNYDLVTHNYYGFSKYFIEQVDFLPNKIIDTLLLSKGKYKGMKSYDMDYILKKYDINTVKGGLYKKYRQQDSTTIFNINK